ncbi:hypothetical protein G9464_13140 [Halostella sp. JP-L12]|uniref:DUF7344 domain-containing protein n=1 Tax=Halostella TaxID=1843185 RepID=UPI000EF83736|nr:MULTISPECIES: hypothetical protein [Halostella]NHN48531.1 hypothetical protein [Halostella sp. JP-L12]
MANEDDLPPAETTKPPDECVDSAFRQEASVSPADLFGVLADDRTRYALYYLIESDGAASVEEIASRVAERERAARPATADATRRVHTSLYHAKLPKLEDHGFVEYDVDAGTVETTDRAAELTPYLRVAERLESDEFTERP